MTAKKLNIQPLADRVVVKPLEEEIKTTAGGIVIPDTAKEKPQLGEVVAVGPGRVSDDGKLIKISVKVGDKVFHSKYGGTNIKIEGEEFIILREDDILAITA
ncbi:MAG TPA: co-chaperone GroES [Firmicutes bacterium]|nr:co-chaperone GroES [Bacillota bacterium]